MQIDLIVKKESDPNSYTITCDLAERLVFGRSIGSPVNLAGSEISREHFVLISQNGQICVQDLSSNGTLVNGKPVTQKKPQKLAEGDVISIPGYEIELGKRPPIGASPRLQRLQASPQIEKTAFHWYTFFTVWELIVIAAALATFVLIVYYIAR